MVFVVSMPPLLGSTAPRHSVDVLVPARLHSASMDVFFIDSFFGMISNGVFPLYSSSSRIYIRSEGPDSLEHIHLSPQVHSKLDLPSEQ